MREGSRWLKKGRWRENEWDMHECFFFFVRLLQDVSDPRGIAGLVQALEKPPPALLAVACHNMASQVLLRLQGLFFFLRLLFFFETVPQRGIPGTTQTLAQ